MMEAWLASRKGGRIKKWLELLVANRKKCREVELILTEIRNRKGRREFYHFTARINALMRMGFVAANWGNRSQLYLTDLGDSVWEHLYWKRY